VRPVFATTRAACAPEPSLITVTSAKPLLLNSFATLSSAGNSRTHGPQLGLHTLMATTLPLSDAGSNAPPARVGNVSAVSGLGSSGSGARNTHAVAWASTSRVHTALIVSFYQYRAIVHVPPAPIGALHETLSRRRTSWSHSQNPLTVLHTDPTQLEQLSEHGHPLGIVTGILQPGGMTGQVLMLVEVVDEVVDVVVLVVLVGRGFLREGTQNSWRWINRRPLRAPNWSLSQSRSVLNGAGAFTL
jgi:hypothetical protein